MEEADEDVKSCKLELWKLCEDIERFERKLPVEVGMEAQEEVRLIVETVRKVVREDVRHGLEDCIGQVYTLGEEREGEDSRLLVYRGDHVLGGLTIQLRIHPDTDVSLVGEDTLRTWGLDTHHIDGCRDTVRDCEGRHLELLGQITLHVGLELGKCLVPVRLLVVRGEERATLSWFAVSALLLTQTYPQAWTGELY